MRQAGTIAAADWNYFLRGAGGVDKVSNMKQGGREELQIFIRHVCY
jgi:hypothetical protein